MAKEDNKIKKEKEKELKFAQAYIKAVRSNPLKINKLAKSLINLSVQDALMKLTFCNLKVAKDLKALVNSAMANAENNHNMDIDNLFIHKIDVGKAFVMKRFKARARGRGNRILKPFSNVRVILVEKNK